MHILYLHQYFNPPDGMGSTRSYEMARRLVKAGHRVTLVTSSAFFPKTYRFEKLVTDMTMDGIALKVIRVAYSNKQSYLRRIFAFFQFAVLSSWVAMGVSGIDVVFASSTPLTIMIPGIAAKWRRGKPMVFEVRDQWPMVPIGLGVLKNPVLIAIATWMERAAYKQAAHIVALSTDMRDGIVALGVAPERVSVIPNSADTEIFRVGPAAGAAFLDAHPQLKGGPLVAYAGTLGFIHGVEYLIHLAAVMRNLDPAIKFAIAGDGAKREALIELARGLGVLERNLWILPPLPKPQVPAMLAASTVACSTIIDNPALWPNSANKFFDAMAAGKPVIINYPGWQKDVLDKTGAGLALPVRDTLKAAKMLKAFLDDGAAVAKAAAASAHLADTVYSRDQLAEELRRVLENARL
jgi:glycosyltransferase involved in cell wall biosynthesis